MDVSNEILAIAQKYLKKIRRSGPENIMAICPFHRKEDGSEETTPSFALSLTKGAFFCHACHASGSLYTFLSELGMDRETVYFKHGMVLEAARRNMPAPPDPTRPTVQVSPEEAIEEGLLGLFDYDVSELLPKFELSTLEHFEVGWDGWHKRITFPIRDLQGHLIAISGRATEEEDWPRYKIYDVEYRCWELPSREGWSKRDAMWNIHRVYPCIAHTLNTQDSYIVVVEGFKALMWLWQSGITNVVALLGSYMSWSHQWILERLGVPVYFFLDQDEAGISGQKDACERLLKKRPYIHTVQYPKRLAGTRAQPDDLTSEEAVVQVAIAPEYVMHKLSS